ILAWADGGGTGVANLGQPCPKHHRLKHATAWQPVGATRDAPPGWISPTGRSYQAEYQDWEPPTWPEPPPAQNWRDPSPGEDWPEPPERPDPPNWPEEPDSFEWFDDFSGPGPLDALEDLDGVGCPMSVDGPEPPLPLDPWPHWASSTAA
ncbi:endonuclease, partial [Arthrobacter globiformis]